MYDIGASTQRIDTVYAAYFVGNGSGITGITTAGTSINSGTSNVKIVSANGNVTVSVAGTSNVAVFGAVSSNIQSNLAVGNLSTVGQISAASNVTGGNIRTVGSVSATGNVTGNYILGNGALLSGIITSVSNINNGNSNVNIQNAGANITVSVNGVANTLSLIHI